MLPVVAVASGEEGSAIQSMKILYSVISWPIMGADCFHPCDAWGYVPI